MQEYRDLPSSRVLLILAVSAMVLTLTGCKTSVRLQPCTGTCISVVGGVSFFEDVESINAWSLYETREVDASLYAHDPNSTPTGTVTVTLSSGSRVSYNTNLYLDTSTTVSPTTSGHTVLVYRPLNPAGLQSFIDQYQGQASSVDISTAVKLIDVSGGSGESTVIDLKGNYNTNLRYMGSVGSTTSSNDPFNKDL